MIQTYDHLILDCLQSASNHVGGGQLDAMLRRIILQFLMESNTIGFVTNSILTYFFVKYWQNPKIMASFQNCRINLQVSAWSEMLDTFLFRFHVSPNGFEPREIYWFHASMALHTVWDSLRPRFVGLGMSSFLNVSTHDRKLACLEVGILVTSDYNLCFRSQGGSMVY